MMYALQDAERVEPTPLARAHCPVCRGEVIAKCGSVKVWHWAHVADECDPWSEPESGWHRMMKELFPLECREVVMANHRADIHFKDTGLTVELQHSSISPETIRDREQFYGNMWWVVDGTDFQKNFHIYRRGDYATFRWYHYRQSWAEARGRVYIYFPDKWGGPPILFRIRKQYDTMKSGWGYVVPLDEWLLTKRV